MSTLSGARDAIEAGSGDGVAQAILALAEQAELANLITLLDRQMISGDRARVARQRVLDALAPFGTPED